MCQWHVCQYMTEAIFTLKQCNSFHLIFLFLVSFRNTSITKMKFTILGVLVFSACFLRVLAAPVAPGQEKCKEGEPLPCRSTD